MTQEELRLEALKLAVEFCKAQPGGTDAKIIAAVAREFSAAIIA